VDLVSEMVTYQSAVCSKGHIAQIQDKKKLMVNIEQSSKQVCELHSYFK